MTAIDEQLSEAQVEQHSNRPANLVLRPDVFTLLVSYVPLC